MCQYGNDDSIDVVEKVCKAVPEQVNAGDKKFDRTPLHWWAWNGRVISIGRCLLSLGANVNAKNGADETPIMLCAQEAPLMLGAREEVRDEKAVELLLDHGAQTKELLDYCKKNGLKNIEALVLSKK